MKMTIQYDEKLPDALQKTKTEFETEAKLAMAAKLFELGRLSSGTAAKLAGLSRTQFLMKLHEFKVPMIQLEEDELQSDMANA